MFCLISIPFPLQTFPRIDIKGIKEGIIREGMTEGRMREEIKEGRMRESIKEG